MGVSEYQPKVNKFQILHYQITFQNFPTHIGRNQSLWNKINNFKNFDFRGGNKVMMLNPQ